MQKYVLNLNIIIIFHTCNAFRKHYVTPLVIVLIVAFGENFNSLSLPLLSVQSESSTLFRICRVSPIGVCSSHIPFTPASRGRRRR